MSNAAAKIMLPSSKCSHLGDSAMHKVLDVALQWGGWLGKADYILYNLQIMDE